MTMPQTTAARPPQPILIGGFRAEYQVKQYVATVNGRFGFRFDVFETGDARYWLFVCVQNPDIRKAYLKTDIEPAAQRALTHGAGHAARPARA
jgi:hypothetical protein